MQEYIVIWRQDYSDLPKAQEPESEMFSAESDACAKIQAAKSIQARADHAYHSWTHGRDASILPNYSFQRVARVIRDDKSSWERSELLDMADMPKVFEKVRREKAAA
jgi:hypothetical protein